MAEHAYAYGAAGPQARPTISPGPLPSNGWFWLWALLPVVQAVWWCVSWALYAALAIVTLPLGLYTRYVRNKHSHHLRTVYDRDDPALQQSMGISADMTKWVLDKAMYLGDTHSDGAFEELAGSWNFRSSALQALRTKAAANPSGPCAALLQEVQRVPEWVDWKQIEVAQRMFWRISPFYLSALYTYSLPLPYCSAAGVAVLALTGRLRDDLYRRLFDTLQFVVDLMTDMNGLHSVGVDSCLKTRLIHSHVRRFVGKFHPQYNAQFKCSPINQAHLLGMLAGFSYHPIQFARMLGLHITDAEHRAHWHMWRYAAYLLGVIPECWVPSPEREAQWCRMAFQLDFTPDDSTRAYVHALLDGERRKHVYLMNRVPDGPLAALLRHAAGDDVYAQFRLPPYNPLWRLTPTLLTGAGLCWNVYRRVLGDFQARSARKRLGELLHNGPGTAASARSGLQVGVSEHRNADGTGAGATVCVAGKMALAQGTCPDPSAYYANAHANGLDLKDD